MKKILLLLLSAACMIGCLSLPAAAEEPNRSAELDAFVQDYYVISMFFDGQFAEGEAPLFYSVFSHLEGYIYENCEKYIVSGEDDWMITYHIPAGEYEALVFSCFEKTDALLTVLHSDEAYKTDKEEPYYELSIGGGLGGELPEYFFQGYVENNGVYETYGYLVQTYEYDDEYNVMPYTPDEGEVEGVDYFMYRAVTSNWEEIDGEWQTTSYSVSYVPAMIVGAMRVLVVYDGETPLYRSYERVEASAVPSADAMTTPEGGILPVSVGSLSMMLEQNTFPEGTSLSLSEHTEGEAYDKAVAALSGVEGFAGVYTVYEITAEKEGEAVQPSGELTVSFPLSGANAETAAVFYVAEDGSVERLTAQIDAESGMAVVVLTHFSSYALVEMEAIPDSSDSEEGNDSGAGTTDSGEGSSSGDSSESSGTETTDKAAKKPEGSPNLTVIAVAAIVAVAVVAVMVVLVRKKKK